MNDKSKPCVVSTLMGGLGNQMFQYAAGKSLALRLNASFEVDLSWFENMKDCTPRNYLLNRLNITNYSITNKKKEYWKKPISSIRILSNQLLEPDKKTHIHEPYFHYWPQFEEIYGNIVLHGYWQSERYFIKYGSIIRQEFSFPPLNTKKATTIKEQILSETNTVSVHIRRGDYISKPDANILHGGCCTQTYYNNAITCLLEKFNKLQLYVFSDDPLWAEQNFDSKGQDTTFINIFEHIESPYHDMHLMSLCKHHIIANSSFSWWGAWLSKRNGVIFSPNRWLNDLSYDTSDLIPKNWIIL